VTLLLHRADEIERAVSLRNLRRDARGGRVSLDIGMEPSNAIPQKILQMARGVDTLFVSSSEPENAVALLQHADGIIVGTSLKKDGVMENAVDVHRVKGLIDRLHAVRERAAVSADSHAEER
jgi:predicted TIM-barrel enzyme